MRSKFFCFLMPLVVLVSYLFFGTALVAFGINSIVGTLIVDVVVALCVFLYMHKQQVPVQGDSTSAIKGWPVKYVFWVGLVAVWLFGQISATWVYETFGDAAFDTYSTTVTSGSSDVLLGVAAVAFICVVAPVAEEFLMRGFVFAQWSKINPWFGLVGSAVVFALLHGTVTHFIPIFMVGLLLAVAYASTGSIWFSVLLHVGYNLAAAVFGGVSVASWLFIPAVFLAIDAALVAWLFFEYKHALDADKATFNAEVSDCGAV